MASLPYEKGMPASAKRVFHGEIYDIWQWPQQLFDGSMATFERASRPDVVEIIATTNRKIIMERQRQPDCKPFICLPSGRVEGNNPLANAKRELLEETGYASNDWQLWQSIQPSQKMVYSIHYYIARDCRKVATPSLDPGEKITTSLVTFDKFLQLAGRPDFRDTGLVKLLLRLRLDDKAMARFQQLVFPAGKKATGTAVKRI